MAGLARRIAPAAALGSLAVIIVGVADPALANLRNADAETGTTALATTEATAPPDTTAPSDTTTSDTTTSDTTTSDTTTSDTGSSDGQAATDCSTGETVTGDSSMTRWGPVQVAATVSGGTICEVHAVAWPANDGKSQMINAYAIPILDESATASQGTQIDYVSGATYTSNGYAQSLQSILDQL